MPTRKIFFANGETYHIFNRGVEKRTIFLNKSDYKRFVKTIFYYVRERNLKYSLSTSDTDPDWNNRGGRLVEILSYCLMPNHFHLLITQKQDKGVSKFLRIMQNSYTRYFNTKYKRVGPLLQGAFKAVHIKSEEQFLHITRYIHLNPFVADLCRKPEDYPWSSYPAYLSKKEGVINTEPILSFFKSATAYKTFIEDHSNYAKSLEKIKHEALDII